MKNLRTILLISLFFLSVGCGAKQDRIASSKPLRPIDENLLDLAPENPTGILWMDVTKLRASALWEAIEELSKSPEGAVLFKDAEAAGLVDPLRQIDEVVLFYTTETAEFPVHGGGDHLLVLFKGTFSAGNVIATLRSNGSGRPVNEGDKPFEIKGFPAVRDGEYMVLALTDRTLAVATPQSAFRLAERASGEPASIENNPDFKDFSIGGSETVKLRYRKGQNSVARNGSTANAEPMEMEGLQGLDGSVVLGDGLVLLADLHMEEESQAAEIEGELKALLQDFSHNMLAVMIGVEWVSDRITVGLSGKSVSISATLDTQDVDELTHLVDRLQKIKQLLDTGDQSPSQGAAPIEIPGGAPDSGQGR